MAMSLGTYSGHPHQKHLLPGCGVQGPPKRGGTALDGGMTPEDTLAASAVRPQAQAPVTHPGKAAIPVPCQRKRHQGKQPNKQ